MTIPNFDAGKVNRVEHSRSDPGGKGVNVASILADAGHSVAVTGFLGRDNVAPFEDLFARKQIVDRFVRIAGQTRVGIKISDPVDQQTTDINFPGQAPAAADAEALMRTLETLDGAWFVLSGSIPPGLDASIYRTLVAALKARGRKVLLDTSGEGLRLALELAAARVAALSVDQIAARLDQRLRLLTGGSRTALPRQQTLRATLDWSYELLTESERCLFNRLSVFAGGWSLEAAEAVCAGDAMKNEDILDVLGRLVCDFWN